MHRRVDHRSGSRGDHLLRRAETAVREGRSARSVVSSPWPGWMTVSSGVPVEKLGSEDVHQTEQGSGGYRFCHGAVEDAVPPGEDPDRAVRRPVRQHDRTGGCARSPPITSRWPPPGRSTRLPVQTGSWIVPVASSITARSGLPQTSRARVAAATSRAPGTDRCGCVW